MIQTWWMKLLFIFCGCVPTAVMCPVLSINRPSPQNQKPASATELPSLLDNSSKFSHRATCAKLLWTPVGGEPSVPCRGGPWGSHTWNSPGKHMSTREGLALPRTDVCRGGNSSWGLTTLRRSSHCLSLRMSERAAEHKQSPGCRQQGSSRDGRSLIA